MKAFDPNYKLLDEMYQDNYYPTFLVDKVKDELQKVIALLESGETDTEVVQETLDEAVCGINDLQEEFDENDSEIETVARECIAATVAYILEWFGIPIDTVPFPVSWTVKMKKKQKETQDILSYHTQAAGCSDKARAKASGGRQPIEECGRTGL
jgi:hypothetical protein